ncbi:MAG TPA: isoprenylcysteine carboxylmethyltransferase family protein [Caulobacteraceae bacterium]|jgi:protein-S-isoprenylcysteine O-methyltransferase Ste14|nr:isoprenylcysteine carboxylmethyltransferase family protein [Caulobacteraceae bacterium]
MPPKYAVVVLWVVWYVTWIAAVVFSRRTTVQMKSDVAGFHRMIASLGVFLLFEPQAAAGFGASRLGGRLWPDNLALDWSLFALATAGFAFCWWARLHLGRLWSGFVTLKEGHHIVDTGPYGLVRHPIYTGVMVAALATALITASPIGLVGAMMVAIGFSMTARIEEGFLRRELGAETYDSYARRVGMLVPRLK